MPEISIFFFDLEQLFKLFPRKVEEKIEEFEQKMQEDMEINRARLFT